MARFNTSQSTISVTGATTLTYVLDKSTILLTGTSGYTVTLASPVPFSGMIQSVYNATGGNVTIAAAAGNIIGNGFTAATSQVIPNNSTYTLTSNGTDYVVTNNEGGPISATTGSFSGTLTANSTVTMSPANANVTASPTGTGTVTINPATAGNINNMAIGGTTRGAGAFTTLDANSTVGLSPANANVTASPTGTGTVTINPATAGNINNMAIGGTTRGAGAFTTLDANSTVGLSPANANVTASPTGTGTVTINPATAGNINNMAIGGTTRGAGAFTTLAANNTTTLAGATTLSSSVTVNGANVNTSISPTGTGTVTVNPGTKGTIDNMDIGATTRGAGNFTTLNANSTVSISGNATFSGTVIVPTPSADSHAVTRTYVDSKLIWGTSGTLGTVSVTTSNLAINIQLSAFTTSGNTISYSLISGSLPSGTSLSSTIGSITGSYTGATGTTAFSFTIRATAGTLTSDRAFSVTIDKQTAPGQQLYEGSNSSTNGGQQTFTWVAPAGVNTVSIAAIGGGGGGYYGWAVCGGAGGGLVWANGVPVTPGSSYTIAAGNGGCWSQQGGGYSCFPGFVAGGGWCGCCSGCYVVSGTYSQACGSYGTVAYPNTAGGGGGGGGYCNNNGWSANSGYTGCYGGGGSATSHHSSTYGTGGGGGTGIKGQGTSGACGNAGYSHQTGSGGQGGSGGTCGKPGEPWSNGQGNGYACGGDYGGGGGGGGTSHGGGWGGKGAVRIIWGTGRSYPSNAADV